jgi:hypothetical protein
LTRFGVVTVQKNVRDRPVTMGQQGGADRLNAPSVKRRYDRDRNAMKMTSSMLGSAGPEHILGWVRDNNLSDRVAINLLKATDIPLIIRLDNSLDPYAANGYRRYDPLNLEEIRKANWRI